MIDVLKEIAKFNCENEDENRGVFYFGENPNEAEKQLGNSFLRLSLECILVWSIWHPFDDNKNPSKFA